MVPGPSSSGVGKGAVANGSKGDGRRPLVAAVLPVPVGMEEPAAAAAAGREVLAPDEGVRGGGWGWGEAAAAEEAGLDSLPPKSRSAAAAAVAAGCGDDGDEGTPEGMKREEEAAG